MVLSAFLARERRNDKVKYFYWNISQLPGAGLAHSHQTHNLLKAEYIRWSPQSSLLHYHHLGPTVFGLIAGTLSQLG